MKIPREHFPLFRAAIPVDERIETKAMFGGLAAVANGQMLAGLFGLTAIVKLSPADFAELTKKGGVPFDPIGNGRFMAETLVLPPGEFTDPERLAAWVAKARDYVVSLPEKKKATKPKKP